MTEKERFLKRINGAQHDFDRVEGATDEEVYATLNLALDAIERGDYEEVTDLDD